MNYLFEYRPPKTLIISKTATFYMSEKSGSITMPVMEREERLLERQQYESSTYKMQCRMKDRNRNAPKRTTGEEAGRGK